MLILQPCARTTAVQRLLCHYEGGTELWDLFGKNSHHLTTQTAKIKLILGYNRTIGTQDDITYCREGWKFNEGVTGFTDTAVVVGELGKKATYIRGCCLNDCLNIEKPPVGVIGSSHGGPTPL